MKAKKMEGIVCHLAKLSVDVGAHLNFPPHTISGSPRSSRPQHMRGHANRFRAVSWYGIAHTRLSGSRNSIWAWWTDRRKEYCRHGLGVTGRRSKIRYQSTYLLLNSKRRQEDYQPVRFMRVAFRWFSLFAIENINHLRAQDGDRPSQPPSSTCQKLWCERLAILREPMPLILAIASRSWRQVSSWKLQQSLPLHGQTSRLPEIGWEISS